MATQKHLSNDIRAHAKIRRDMEIAYALLSSLVHATEDQAIHLRNEAAFTAAVIGYARSFTNTRGGTVYHLKELKEHRHFDRKIHDHLVEMRNRLIAHADEDAFPVDVFLTELAMETDLQQVFMVGTVVHVHGFKRITDLIFLYRVLRHIRACVEMANTHFKRDSLILIQQENEPEKVLSRASERPHMFSETAPDVPSTNGEIYTEQNIEIDWTNTPTVSMADKYEFSSYIFQTSVESISVMHQSGEVSEMEIKASLLGG